MPNNNLYQERFAQGFSKQYPPSRDGGNLYQQLLDQGFTKQDIDNTIYKVIMYQLECKKAYQRLSLTGKIKWHLKRYSEQAIGLFLHLTAKGLILLKTQFAKKPKNPV